MSKKHNCLIASSFVIYKVSWYLFVIEIFNKKVDGTINVCVKNVDSILHYYHIKVDSQRTFIKGKSQIHILFINSK